MEMEATPSPFSATCDLRPALTGGFVCSPQAPCRPHPHGTARTPTPPSKQGCLQDIGKDLCQELRPMGRLEAAAATALPQMIVSPSPPSLTRGPVGSMRDVV